MTDETSPVQRGDELASQAGLRASHVDRDRVVELLRVAAGDGKVSGGHITARPPRRTFWQRLGRHPQPDGSASR